MSISKSDVNAGSEKASAFIDDAAGVIHRGTSSVADEAKKTIQSTAEKVDRAIDATNRKTSATTGINHHSGDLISELFGLGARYAAETLQHRRAQLQQLTSQSVQKTVGYVQRKPLRAVLIAAGAGAVIAALLASNSRRVR